MKKLVIALCLCFASGIFTSYVETSYVYLTECYIKEPLKSLLLDASKRCDSLYAKKTNKNKNVKPSLDVTYYRNIVDIVYDDHDICLSITDRQKRNILDLLILMEKLLFFSGKIHI